NDLPKSHQLKQRSIVDELQSPEIRLRSQSRFAGRRFQTAFLEPPNDLRFGSPNFLFANYQNASALIAGSKRFRYQLNSAPGKSHKVGLSLLVAVVALRQSRRVQRRNGSHRPLG